MPRRSHEHRKPVAIHECARTDSSAAVNQLALLININGRRRVASCGTEGLGRLKIVKFDRMIVVQYCA